MSLNKILSYNSNDRFIPSRPPPSSSSEKFDKELQTITQRYLPSHSKDQFLKSPMRGLIKARWAQPIAPYKDLVMIALNRKVIAINPSMPDRKWSMDHIIPPRSSLITSLHSADDMLFTGDYSGQGFITDLNATQIFYHFNMPKPISFATPFSPYTTLVSSAGGEMVIVDVRSSKTIYFNSLDSPLNSLCLSGMHCTSLMREGGLSLWDMRKPDDPLSINEGEYFSAIPIRTNFLIGGFNTLTILQPSSGIGTVFDTPEEDYFLLPLDSPRFLSTTLKQGHLITSIFKYNSPPLPPTLEKQLLYLESTDAEQTCTIFSCWQNQHLFLGSAETQELFLGELSAKPQPKRTEGAFSKLKSIR